MKVLCRTSDIPDGGAKGFDLGTQRYIVVRESQSFFVYHNRCPHLGVPLDWMPDDFMDPESGLLRCATHGALFLPETGECVVGPCLGQFLTRIPFSLNQNQITIDSPSD